MREYSQPKTLDSYHRVSLESRPKCLPLNLGRPNLFWTGILFLLSDTVCLIVAPALAYKAWAVFNPDVNNLHSFWPALLLFWAILGFKGLYPGVGMTSVEQLRRIFRIVSLIYLLLGTAALLSRGTSHFSRGVFICAGLSSICLLPLGRVITCRLFSSRDWWGAPVVILGAGETAKLVIKGLRAHPMIGFKPIACLDDDTSKHGECEGVPVVGPLSSAYDLAQCYRIRHTIIAMPGITRQRLLSLLEVWSRAFPNIILIPDLFGVSSLWVSARDLNGILGLEIKNNLLIPLNRWIKRGIDVSVSAIGLLLSLPVILICALWVRAVSPGRAFYFQAREGFGDQIIRICKIRTMYPDSDRILDDYLKCNPAANTEWKHHFKLKNDPRVLPIIGHFLRCTSLDELPQLWNVFIGEMSLVGPRPFPSYHTERFDPEFRALRRKVVPGLTGLWQISSRSDGDLTIQKQLDSYYIRNWSIWLDIYILGCTAEAVIKGDGAY
jgi:Undecaprenyl-phosphate galactose phosphotransferase WbaP